MNRMASADIAKKPPTACIGLEPRPRLIPAPHRSGPFVLVAISPWSLKDRDSGHRGRPTDVVRQGDSCAIYLVDGLCPKLSEKLHTLRDSGRTGRVSLALQSTARIHRQRPTDTGDLGLDELVCAEPVGEPQALVADQLDAGEE